MANKDLFKQAIAEAKSVREAAIANAKEALEETLTPHLKDMLAAKLQEMEEKSEEVEEVVNEVEEEEVEEGTHSKEEEAIEEELTAVEEAEDEEAEDDSEESEDEAEHSEEEHTDETSGDEELGDLTVDQFKDMIRDIIAQEVGGDAPADDMDGGDIEGMGDEAPIEEPELDGETEIGAEEEEIDLDELIRELESVEEMSHDKDKKDETVEEDTSVQVNAESDGSDYNINRVAKLKEELKQATDTIELLKKDLNEVNILNSKLLYVNKIFKSTNLSESQKVNVIAAFDKAETVKEVKLVFETVSDNVGTKKETTIKEHKGSASKATGTTAKKPEIIAEVSDAVRRMQKLAGIIK